MKKRMAFLLVLAMMMTIFAAPVLAADYESKWSGDYADETTDVAGDWVSSLYAGQFYPCGKILIDEIGTNKYLVTYDLNNHPFHDWYLAEIHFEAVDANDEPFIMSGGGFKLGKFTVKESFDPGTQLFSFEYQAEAPVLYFVAHAVVYKPATTCYPAQWETAYGCGDPDVPGANWAKIIPIDRID